MHLPTRSRSRSDSLFPHRGRGAGPLRWRLCAWWIACVAATAWIEPARAEGTAQLGTTQALRAGTRIGVDVLDARVETLRWTGNGTVSVYGPSGAWLRSASSGQTIVPVAGNGVYELRLGSEQSIGATWDVAVLGRADTGGRAFSTNWTFNAGSYAVTAATSGSFFALVPGGDGSQTSVIELKLDGLAGYIYDINANRRGVDGVNAGRSVPEAGNTTTPEYKLYLTIPTVATFSNATPGVFGLDYVGGVSVDVAGQPIAPCDQILPGASRGYFYFTSTTEGSYQMQCDLDHDAAFSIGTGRDLLILGTAAIGTNVVAWDGRNDGVAITTGDYVCRVRVTVGEFHYVGRDIETSYPGMRMFRVNADRSRTGLAMYWNDSLVQAADVLMPNGQHSRVGSEGSVLAGTYGGTTLPNVNGRSWGDFSGNGKGNVTFLDTYVWLDESTSSTVSVRAADDTDADADGLSDFLESCVVGSSPADPDTDADGVLDGAQYAVPESSAFSGLESNGRMSVALARRAIRRTRMSPATNVAAASVAGLDASSELDGWLPSEVAQATPVLDAPRDLLEVTNARAVAGADYHAAGGAREGGVLLIATEGEVYEHQKAICDRVRGARLLDVRPTDVHGARAFASVLSSPDEGRVEYSLSLVLSQDPATGVFTPAPMWLREDAPPIPAGGRVVTIQAWGRTPGFANEAVAAVVARIAADYPVAWPVAPPVLDDEQRAQAESVEAPARTVSGPTVLVENVRTLGGHTTITLRRTTGSGPVQLRVVSLGEDGTSERVDTIDVDVASIPVEQALALPRFLDATIDVLDGERVSDRVWVTDGAWAPFDDGLWGSDAGPVTFSRTACTVRDPRGDATIAAWARVPGGDTTVFSGCAETTRANGGAAGVARHFTRPLDLRAAGALVYWAASDHAYEVCLESAATRTCVSMPASSGRWEAVPTNAFDVVAPELVTFTSTSTRGLVIEVSGLALASDVIDTRPAPVVPSICSSAPGRRTDTRVPAAFGLVVAAIVIARRRTASSRRRALPARS